MKLRRLLRYFTYFRRAYSIYFSLPVSLWNFIVIQYALFISRVPILKSIFTSFIVFVFSFFFVCIPIAIIVGWIDYKKLTISVDLALAAKHNPYSVDIAKALYLLASGENEKAKKILEKWIDMPRR